MFQTVQQPVSYLPAMPPLICYTHPKSNAHTLSLHHHTPLPLANPSHPSHPMPPTTPNPSHLTTGSARKTTDKVAFPFFSHKTQTAEDAERPSTAWASGPTEKVRPHVGTPTLCHNLIRKTDGLVGSSKPLLPTVPHTGKERKTPTVDQ